jgi:rubredoxin
MHNYEKLIVSIEKVIKPTPIEFQRYNGGSCHKLWNDLDESWVCPACGRSKYQILRYKGGSPIYNGNPEVASNLIAPLARHHDHSRERYADSGKARFKETVICQDCNSAEAAAKTQLKLPQNFSFSPNEIGEFVLGISHGTVSIDFYRAWQIWCEYEYGRLPII